MVRSAEWASRASRSGVGGSIPKVLYRAVRRSVSWGTVASSTRVCIQTQAVIVSASAVVPGRSQVLPNLLFVIVRGAPAKVVRGDLVCRKIEGGRDMLHETARDLLPVLGNRPSHWQYLKRDHESQAIHPALIREQTVFLGSIVKWSVSSWGVKYWRIALSFSGFGYARNEGFWPTVVASCSGRFCRAR